MLQESCQMHKTLRAAPAIVQLDQTEFRTSYAERERISVTGSPLPKRSSAAFWPIVAQSDHDSPQSQGRMRLAFLPGSLGRPALVAFTTPSLHDFLRLRQRAKKVFAQALMPQLSLMLSKWTQRAIKAQPELMSASLETAKNLSLS